MKGSVDSIETFGLVDGPGIRTVVFLSGCNLRCKFCHNPEMWKMSKKDYTSTDIVNKVLRSKPYFKNNGGVTFSGGEPLLQYDFLVETCKKLKEEDIHICLDTAGIGLGNYKEILELVDIVLLDVKHIDREGVLNVTQRDLFDNYMSFIDELNKSGKEVWIRQVIVPGIHDNVEYLKGLSDFLKTNVKNIKRVDFLPFHRLGREKYISLGITYPYEDKDDMNKDLCDQLYNKFKEEFDK